MIKTVARQYHWSPSEIGKLYLDDWDYLGLEYWYNDAAQIDKELKAKPPKKS